MSQKKPFLSSVKRFRYVTWVVLAAATLLALVPVGRLASGWAGGVEHGPTTTRSTDWTRWTQQPDGTLVADYVHPSSPAARAGLHAGDALYMFSYRPYRDRDTLRQAVAAVPPGETRTFHVLRGERFERLSVTLTTQPAFLHPLSPNLWTFSLWSFGFGAFFHLLGLIVVAPLTRRSRRTRFSLLLLAASSLWVFSTLLRLLIIETVGLPDMGAPLRRLFDGLAVAGMIGWGVFPALLLHKVVCDTQEAAGQTPTRWRFAAHVPFLSLGAVVLAFAPDAPFQPGVLHALTAPVLLYTCCFIAAATVLVLVYLRMAPPFAPAGSWSDTGGAFLLLCALGAAALVVGFVPFFEPVTSAAAGWLVVAVQLLSTVPVALVTLATLRHVTLSGLVTRALTYVSVLGAIFFAFVGGYTAIDTYFPVEGTAHHVVVGLFVILLLAVFERLARRVRLYANRFFATGPERARETLSRFQEQMRTILTHEALVQRTAAAVGEAFGARSVRLFLQAAPSPDEEPGEDDDRASTSAPDAPPDESDDAPPGWIIGTHHPQPPYFTRQHFERVWPYLQREGRVWARNPEIRDSTLPDQRAQMLEERGVALALPIAGDGQPIGLLAIGGKKKRGALYDRSDLDLLRFLAGQLALATERLDLVARERALARASARAELAALRAQINPHFLFNALNTIASLIDVQPERAETTVEHLSAIFRHILQTGSQSFVPLSEELTLVRHYLHIEQVRFGDALAVEIDLPPALRDYPVPAFAVQTLVENAVKHGIAKQRGGGHVRVAARRLRLDAPEERAVEITVDDTGAGIPSLFPTSGDGAPADDDGERPPNEQRMDASAPSSS
ncbi:MAG: hypothetical protein BRD46_05705, partial [Bacteroidetes bacterium QS_8_68_15]